MKRFISLFLILIMLFSFSSCQKSKPDTALYKGEYESEFQMKYRSYHLKGEIKRQESGICQMVLSEPEELKDLSVIYENDNMIITLNDIIINSDSEGDESKNPIKTSFAGVLFRILNKIASNDAGLTFGDKKIEGVIPESEFTVTLSENGNLESIEAADAETKVTFTNFKFK